MTRNQYLAAAAVAFSFAASPALAATADQAAGSGHSVILSPLTFVNDTDLNFGSVVLPTGVAGAIQIDPDPTVTGFVTNTGVLPIPASAPTRGLMIGAGTAGSDVTVQTTFPSKLFLNGDPTLASLNVALNVDKAPIATDTYTYKINSGQSFQVHVGGRVDIPAGTANGPYSNTYTVTATYP